MKRRLRIAAVVAVTALVAAACAGEDSPTAPSTPAENLQKGGTLRIGLDSDVFTGFDPQKEYYQVSFAFYRCCLLRTLMSYNGLDAENDGTKIFPDLATGEPTISEDGLEWTFTIKKGLKYAPPMEAVEITAEDFIRAIKRTATPAVGAGYPGYYSVIEGFDEYSAGDADEISGMTAPDPYTLQISLTKAVGYLGYMFTMPTTAPIPPNPDDPDAALGVAEGHDEDYGRFMVASGPYMWAGSEAMDFSLPAKDQKFVEGYQPNKRWHLVRNPSWDEATDDLRKAYVDEIDAPVTPGAEPSVLEKKVQNDELDTYFENTVSPKMYRTFTNDPELKDRVFLNPAVTSNYYIGMNLGTPPFDDLALRKAVHFAVDKAGIVRLQGGETAGTLATHFVPDALLTTSDGTNLMEGYDPYPSTGNQGADSPDGLESAKAEMAKSKYDTDQDGLCDAPECSDILAIGGNSETAANVQALISDNLAAIGMSLDIKQLDGGTAYAKQIDPRNKIPMFLGPGWIADWPDAFTFYYFTMYGPTINGDNNSNPTMIGASPEQMEEFGYEITDVPGMNDMIDDCIVKTGDEAIQCWAEVDKYQMENVASVLTYVISNVTNVVSSRVLNYTFAAGFDSQMAYDQVALQPGSD